ncbi:MAG: hypothetical protein ACREHV_06505, partial [Rhizomicrobium sp.]
LWVWTGKALVSFLPSNASLAVAFVPSEVRLVGLPERQSPVLAGSSIVWTGKQVIVWGGGDGLSSNSGEALSAAAP